MLNKCIGDLMNCELCTSDGGELLWRNNLCRVVLVDDAEYPGFCRVILNQHIQEMTQLSVSDRHALMVVVFAVELAIREIMQPDKINLASLGNMVPHLHWHVIPRFSDDKHFPNPVWGEARRNSAERNVNKEALRDALVAALG